MPQVISVLFMALIVLSPGYAFAQSAKKSEEPIEVVVGGKTYPSLHAYKLQRFKDDLRGVLSSAELREFSAREIAAVILELQSQPSAPEVTEPAADGKTGEMEEMLEDYRAAHPDAPPPEADPRKVKTIIIKPSSPQQE